MRLNDAIYFKRIFICLLSLLGGFDFLYAIFQIPNTPSLNIDSKEIIFFISVFMIGFFTFRRLLCILLSYRLYEYLAITLTVSASFMYSSSTYAPFSFGILFGAGLSIVLIGLISKEDARADSRCDETLSSNKPIDIKYLLGLFGVIVLSFYVIQSMVYKDDATASIQKVKKITRTDKTNTTIAKQYGLLEHNLTSYERSWHLDYDDNYIYTISTHYDKTQERDTDYSYIDIFDIDTLKLINKKKIYTNIDTSAPPIVVDDKDIYTGGTSYIINRDKTTLECYHSVSEFSCQSFKSKGFRLTSHSILKLKKYKNYMFAFGNGDQIYLFENKKLLYTIDERDNYPRNIKTIKDYSFYNRINDIVIHKDVIYALNWRGFINEYALKNGKFLRQINTMQYYKKYGYTIGDPFNTAAIYKNRYIYFAEEYYGILILDTKIRKFSRIKTLFQRDSNKTTTICKMVFYQDNLIFSEVDTDSNFIYVYNLKSKKIIYKYKGHIGDVTDMFIKGDNLISLSNDGYIYKWDLGIISKKNEKSDFLLSSTVNQN